MRFENLKNLKVKEFRRLTGVQLKTFKKMEEIIETALRKRRAQGGRPNKFCAADMILMALEYLRE